MSKIKLFIIICTLFLVGCGGRQETISSVEEKEDVKIGISFDSFVIERWHREQDIFVSKAEELGAKVYVQNANGDVKKQIDQIEHLIAEKVDTIVIIPTDGKALMPVVKKAMSQGIKVMAYDRMIENANVDCYISFDNSKIGQIMVEGLMEKIQPKGSILVIMGSKADNNVEIIDEQFEKILTKRKDVTVIDKVYANNWRSEDAFIAVSKHLMNKEHIDGIFCGNDDLAQQAIMALSEYRQAGEVYVIGQDADLAACQRIVEGTQYMTVYKNVLALARQAASVAVALAKGEKIEGQEVISDGTYEVPYSKLDVTKVTHENMDEVIIDSGFHLKEEVYLNLSEKEVD